MKDKVIKLENDLEFSVLDEIKIDNIHYIFGVQVSNETDVLTENYILMKVEYKAGKSFVNNVTDDGTYDKISKIFMERLKKANS